MRKLISFFSFLVFFTSGILSQPDTVSITEGNEVNLCGKIVIVDAVWMNNGNVKADISILEQMNSKPVTGGYGTGDEITISSEPGCTYFVFSIMKNGSNGVKGSVILSKKPPESRLGIRKDEIIMEDQGSYSFGVHSWHISSIRNEGGVVTAYMTVTQNTNIIETITLVKGDLLWIDSKLYKAEIIEARSEFIKTDPERIYEPLPGRIVLKAVKEYLFRN